MNTFRLRVSFFATLTLAFLSLTIPASVKAQKVPTSHTGRGSLAARVQKITVPEPSSFVLLGTGLVLAALALRSKGIGLR